tara:strand:+ start:142 stop:639 length:498 start_codon:yes stop_codon:yes gene_type:complete
MNTSNPLDKSHKAASNRIAIMTIIGALLFGGVAYSKLPADKLLAELAKADEDLAKLQGKWTRIIKAERWVKEIKGDKETFTIFVDNQAIYGHTHTIRVSKQGPVRIYATSKGQITIGERRGEKTEPFSFIYKLNKGILNEGLGLLNKDDMLSFKPEVVTWTRAED